jgi:DNA-binding LytR/AlgR family response regulator
MKAIIVDDEPKAIDLLEGYLIHFPAITLSGCFRNALKALEFLRTNPVDLVFLDIQMPHLSGISFSRIIGKETQIIFTTAHADFAVESYEVEAVDYLLKPISLERFTKAVTKALSSKDPPGSPHTPEYVFIKSGSSVHRISVDEILYLQKDGNYMTYNLEKQKILARESTSEALQRLPSWFVQTHKSFIVNLRRIQVIEKDHLQVGSHSVPIGSTFREAFLKVINHNGPK